MGRGVRRRLRGSMGENINWLQSNSLLWYEVETMTKPYNRTKFVNMLVVVQNSEACTSPVDKVRIFPLHLRLWCLRMLARESLTAKLLII